MQQAELAKLVGVRRETIGNLENGKYNSPLKPIETDSVLLKASMDGKFPLSRLEPRCELCFNGIIADYQEWIIF